MQCKKFMFSFMFDVIESCLLLWLVPRAGKMTQIARCVPKPPIPPLETSGHLTFLKNFGQIPRYVASLDGQMPHPLEGR